ncbi:WD40 repeat-like protein [Phytophthora palmivora]|uniref:WD40 repeat-like protein n=1 Tax=Phytophthora palmivora TaxID=4796 RepID=A0A2P4WXC8_9STRA|nr:WD40 repeat-like protein [Phytophthora palmivora]
MGKAPLKLDTPDDGTTKGSRKKKPSPRSKGRPRKSAMRKHRRESFQAELAEEAQSPQAESPLLKSVEEVPQQSGISSSTKSGKPSRRMIRLPSHRSNRAEKGNNDKDEHSDTHQSPISTARHSGLMSWRNSTTSIVEDTAPASCPLSCQPSACFIGSLNGTISEMHLPLLTKQTKARINALKAESKQRQLEVTIERSDELPFGAYSHPQVRVHIVDRCTGRALCPAQMTSEAKFYIAADCANMPTLLNTRTVLLFEILETKPLTKGTRFRRGKRFEAVSTHDEDDEYHKLLVASTPDYRRVAWGFFHTITSKGTPTMNSFVLPDVPDANENEKMKRESIVDVCGLRVRLFEYQVLTWMDNYQAKSQWGWRKNHPTVPAVFLQYQKRSRVPAPSTLHVQLRAVSPATSPQQAGVSETTSFTNSVVEAGNQEADNATVNTENGAGDNQVPPAEISMPVVEETGGKIASPETTSSDLFDLMAPCKRNVSEPCLIPHRVLFRLWEIPLRNPASSETLTSSRSSRLLLLVFQWHHFPCFVYCASFLPGSNGEIVLTGSSDGCMRMRKESSVPNGQPEYGMIQVSSAAVHAICIDGKSGRMFCGDANGYITVWRRMGNASALSDYERIKTIETGQNSITSLQLHPRKAHLLVHTQPNAIFQYELRSYLLLNKSYAGVACKSLLVKSTFSPDGRLVISGSEDGVPRLFTSLHGEQLQRGVWGTHFFHGFPVLDVSWSPTAHMAALCSYGGNNPIVVLCSYRDDQDAVYIDEPTTNAAANFKTSLQKFTVEAFRGFNQQGSLGGDHAQRLQRALERRQKRLQAKVFPVTSLIESILLIFVVA